MNQYCVYTRDDRFLDVTNWLKVNKIKIELHLNRIRFWVPDGPVLTDFLLRFSNVCPAVAESDDYVTS